MMLDVKMLEYLYANLYICINKYLGTVQMFGVCTLFYKNCIGLKM